MDYKNTINLPRTRFPMKANLAQREPGMLKDMVVKSRQLAGFHSPYVPGWDCHGLPIEHQVEKKHGKVGRKLDAAAFRAECRRFAEKQIDRQREGFKRLGVLGDWDEPYITCLLYTSDAADE